MLARSRNFPPRFLQGRASRGFFPLAFYELISRITREQACDECGNKLNIKVGDNGEGFFSLWERGTIAFFSPLPHKFFFHSNCCQESFPRGGKESRAFFTNPSSVNTRPYKASPDRNIIFAPFWDRKRGCRLEIVITSSTIYRGKTLVFLRPASAR